jgi:outer membrane protein assembly factor BamA
MAAHRRVNRTLLSVGCQTILLCAVSTVFAADPAHVRNIEFERQPIFSQADRERFTWLPLAWVDRMHVDTRVSVIREELLFTEGTLVDQEQLDESARKLRETGFFSDVDIFAVAVASDSVDVRIVTRELWTTAIDASYEKFEDELLWSLRFRERNFLGSARSFEFGRTKDLDRSSWIVGLGDRQLFGGKWRGNVVRAKADDGDAFAWSLSRPFFELTDRYQLRSSYFQGGSAPRYYLSRDRYIRPHLDYTEFTVVGQRRAFVGPTSVWRFGLGFSLRHQRFASFRTLEVRDPSGPTGETASLGADPAENRRWHTPLVSIERQTRDYAQTRFLFEMGRVEDIPLGWDFEVQLGWTTRVLNSSETGAYFQVRQDYFLHHGGGSFDRVQINGGGLVRAGEASNTSMRLQLSTYRPLGESTLAAASVLGAMGDGLDRHRAFNLGLASGLRAARFRELTGDRLLRGNAELRWVHRPGLWSFLTPGLAAFGDFGTAWFESERDLSSSDIRGAIGAGLRLGFSRAANEVPIRVDLAWPLLYPSEQGSPVLSIGTGHVF